MHTILCGEVRIPTKEACQMHREYYRGYPKAYHPLKFFQESDYSFQCPPEMSNVYLGFPAYHVKYKQPVGLPATIDRTSFMPQLPTRCLKARYGQTAKAYMR
ncbi:uncharacterized protein LOC142979852 isoform X2 [Anticarsia gemmatalis]|uniref:uncharacterized protein LOC142979852 isoform X2 n=1 Tax=Anticarsia gemmatalis TaxID=129554 RepID=UPI003F75F8CB